MNDDPATLLEHLDADDGSARVAALRALRAAPPAGAPEALLDRIAPALAFDPAPAVRREALLLIFALDPAPAHLAICSLSDPVWRVRNRAIQLLARWGEGDEARRQQVRAWVGALAPSSRVSGALEALERAWGREPRAAPGERWGDRARALPFWDEDPAVLLARMRRADLAPHGAALLALLTLDDCRQVHETSQAIREAAMLALLEHGDEGSDLAALRALDEPRHPYLAGWVFWLLDRLPAARRQALAGRVQGDEAAFSPLARRWARGQPGGAWASYFARPPARSAAWGPPGERAAPGEVPAPRRVSRLILSGRHGLDPEGYREAIDAGLTTLFFEPDHEAMGQFIASMRPAERATIGLVAGTFEAEPRAIRRDAERMLRLLKASAVDDFLLFWARSPGRLGDEVIDELLALRRRGLIRRWGLSTHDRALGITAIERGAEAVMARYSAAHRGAEEALLPAAARSGVPVYAFSCVSHGRLLERAGPHAPASAPDCYRFALAHPAIQACIMAPRSHAELRDNLAVLRSPGLTPDRVEALRALGDAIHRARRDFFDLVRSR